MTKEIKILESSWSLTKKSDIFLAQPEYQNIANAIEIIREASSFLQASERIKSEPFKSYVVTNTGKPVTKNPVKKKWIEQKHNLAQEDNSEEK